MAVAGKTKATSGSVATKVKAKAVDTETDIKVAAADYFDIACQVEEILSNPLFAEFDMMKKAFLAALDDTFGAYEKGVLNLDNGSVSYTMKKASNTINTAGKKKIIDQLGFDTYIELSTVSMTKLKDYLSKKVRDEIVETDRKGARTLKVKRFK